MSSWSSLEPRWMLTYQPHFKHSKITKVNAPLKKINDEVVIAVTNILCQYQESSILLVSRYDAVCNHHAWINKKIEIHILNVIQGLKNTFLDYDIPLRTLHSLNNGLLWISQYEKVKIYHKEANGYITERPHFKSIVLS